jgi:hypothetical protein
MFVPVSFIEVVGTDKLNSFKNVWEKKDGFAFVVPVSGLKRFVLRRKLPKNGLLLSAVKVTS